ncbi:helix-turn-helix domain-containing protein [[Actinomadura] parvosata]|uniref:helix-turn-helix domain-containing protein n=1 Tax=[Actinomadura] parvosata TaxID=1955412 RepID=UPI00406CFF45
MTRCLLTITWDMSGDYSAEEAAALAERWAAQQIRRTRLPQPIQITVTGIPDGKPADVPAISIAARRKALGLTQRQVAHIAGTTSLVVSKVERGLIGPRHALTAAIMRALDRVEAVR